MARGGNTVAQRAIEFELHHTRLMPNSETEIEYLPEHEGLYVTLYVPSALSTTVARTLEAPRMEMKKLS